MVSKASKEKKSKTYVLIFVASMLPKRYAGNEK